jgi:hypothetical protein
MIYMKVEKKNRILLCSWLPTRTYNKNLNIWIFFLRNLANLGYFFSMKNPLYIGQNIIFQVEIFMWNKGSCEVELRQSTY